MIKTNLKLILIASIIFSFAPAGARAALPVGVPTITVGDVSPTGIANAFSLKATNWKEYIGDKLAYIAAKQVLQRMTVSVVNWINTGFKGKPSFLTNPEGFFLDAADQITGELLSEKGPLRRLCSPWSVDIKVALAIQQLETSPRGFPSSRRYTCTLSRIIDSYQGTYVNGASIDGFIKGDFKQGGWPAFIALTTEDQNNPIGTILMARSDQLFAVSQKKSFVQTDLLQGKGFLSWESCEDAGLSDEEAATYRGTSSGGAIYKDGPDGRLQKCQYKTPGSVIEASLGSSLQSPARQLELADNINAVVSALVSQLVTQTLQKGLYALSSGGSGPGSGRLYLQQIYTNSVSPQPGAGTASNSTVATLNLAKTNYDAAVALINLAYEKYSAAQACFTGKYGKLTPEKATEASAMIAQINTTLYTDVNPLLTELSIKRDGISNAMYQAQTSSLPPDDLVNAIQTQINSIGAFLSGTNLAGLVTSSASDLELAQTKSETFAADAESFQRSCSRL